MSFLGIQKNGKNGKQEKISFKGNNDKVSSSSAVESLAKAKIALDSAYTKPISLEDKIEILKAKEVGEEKVSIFLAYNDEEFKSAISYLDEGLTPDEVDSVVNPRYGRSESDTRALDLTKSGVPFSVGKELYSSYGMDKSRVDFLKDIKLDFSQDLKYFKIDDYKLKKALRDDDLYEQFTSLINKGVNGNIALKALDLYKSDYAKMLEMLEHKSEINNSARCAYFINRVQEEEFDKIVSASKKHNLDFNDYNFWIEVAQRRDVDITDKYIEMGVPLDALSTYIGLDDDKLKTLIKFAKDNKLQLKDVIELQQATMFDDDRKQTACELLKRKGVDKDTAYRLSGYDKPLQDEMIGYLQQGLSMRDAISLAMLKKDADFKSQIIPLLGIFEYVDDAKIFLEMDLSKEDKEKYLDLIKKGANTYLASYCLKSKVAYDEVISLYEDGVCDSLEGIYGAFDDNEFLSQTRLIRLGIPKDRISIYSCTLTPEQEELLQAGVSFEDLKTLESKEDNGEDCTQIKEVMKKGASFAAAKEITDRVDISGKNGNIILNNVYEGLSSSKILTLANIEQERGANWIKDEDKELTINFLRKLQDYEKFIEFYDLGFFNEKAFKNYEEFLKRGVNYRQSNNAIMLSQLDFNSSNQYDRAAELMKRKTPFAKILFGMNDDKSFMEAINSDKKEEYYMDYTKINSYLIKLYQMGLNKDDVELIAEKCHYSSVEDLNDLIKYIKKGHTTQDALNISTHTRFIRNSKENREEQIQERDFISDLILTGCNFEYLKDIYYDDKKVDKLKTLINKGVEPKLAEKLTVFGISPDDEKRISKIKQLENTTINDDLKKLSGNPTLYPFIDELFNFNNYDQYQFQSLLKSTVSLEDVFKSAKTFIKSPLKQAMKRPNLYLSGIPLEDTEKVNGQYPKLSDEKMKDYQEKMLEFFKGRMPEITRALKYLDVDTFNQLMDKRTTLFAQQLEMLDMMDDKHYELVSKITKCRKEDGKLLSSKEKIDLARIVLYHQLGYLDTDYLEEMVENGKVDINHLNEVIFEKLIETIGLEPKEAQKHQDKLDFDEEYMFLLLRTQNSADFMQIRELLYDKEKLQGTILEMEELLNDPENLAHYGYTEESCKALVDLLKRAEYMEEKEVYKEFSKISPFASVDVTAQDVARIAILNDYKEYITDKSNDIGKINAQTEKKFKKLGLDYDKWLNYSKKSQIEFSGHKFDIKLWDRYPQKDLFMGNRTSCCTAIIEGANGKATPVYLSNTAFNVVQLKDENGNILAMSRIFVGNIDEKPSLVIENIEINAAFLKDKTEDELKELRNKMFDFVKTFGKDISKDGEMKVYFSKNYTHVPLDDYETVKKEVDFVGDILSESVYLNCKPGWCKPEELKNEPCEIYEIL